MELPPLSNTLFIIGDSTVKNGQGDGRDGLWGWGHFLVDHFDTSRIVIENHAIGGRSSRSFQTEGRWERVLEKMSPGDFVLIQFGHNDGGSLNTGRARGTLKGSGMETKDVIMERDSSHEVIHTYGWYIEKYVKDFKAAGGIPVVLSLIPRNIWTDQGEVIRASDSYGKWAAEAAANQGAYFVDLNEIVAAKYEIIGKEKVGAEFFLKDHTHTTLSGARVNAAALVEGVRALDDCTLGKFLSREPVIKWLGNKAPLLDQGLSWGVPWAAGLVQKDQAFKLSTPDGSPMPLQTWPMAYWPDGSIKWLGCATIAGPDNAGPLKLASGPGLTLLQGIEIEENGTEIIINTDFHV